MSRHTRIFIVEFILTVTISLSLCTPYLYSLFSEKSYFVLFGTTYNLEFYASVQLLVYFILIKFSYLLVFFVWYVTCEFWWREAILPLILLNLFQLTSLINDEFSFSGEGLSSYLLFLNTVLFLLMFAVALLLRKYLSEFYLKYPKRSSDILSYFKFSRQRLNRENEKIKELRYQRIKSGNENYIKELISRNKALAELLLTPYSNEKLRQWKGFNIFITAFLHFCPLLFFIYKFVPPDVKVWDAGFFTIKSPNMAPVQIIVYYLVMKFIMFGVLSIWFLTTRFWWKYSILIPLSIVCYQMVEILKPDIIKIDHYEIWYSLPIILLVFVLLIWISTKIRHYANTYDLYEDLEREISGLIKELNHSIKSNDIKHELELLLVQKNELSEQDYFQKLQELKDKFKD